MQEFQNGESFINMLKLKEENLGQINLKNSIKNTFAFAERIWFPGQQMDEFTDHGLRHSLEVLKRALEIADNILVHYPLSDLEKTILSIASLIHDIGMQAKKYEEWKDLSHSTIRDSHCMIGYNMFIQVLENKKNDLPNLALTSPELEPPMIFEKAMRVAFSHCSRDKKAKELWSALNNSKVKDNLCRLRLLGGVLRLGDELHWCFDRVPEINRIVSSTLPQESKAHWAACFYISNVQIQSGSDGRGSIRVLINWRAPNDNKQIEMIRALIMEKRIQHFNKEINLVKPYLKESESSAEPIIEEIRELPPPEIHEMLGNLPREVENYIKTTLLKHTYGDSILKEFTNLVEIKDDEFANAKKKSYEFVQLGRGVYPAHYVLKTGYHTNKYVKCRDLISDINFTISLTKALANKFGKEFSITRIISIGTTSIRIGSLLSVMLNLPFSYAVGDVKIEINNFPVTNNFELYETVISVDKNDKILIIDDILGIGTVFERIMKQLKTFDIPEENIIFFYIYSLGHEKKFLSEYPKVRVYFLNSFPDIEYWKEDSEGKCEVCQNEPEIREYE